MTQADRQLIGDFRIGVERIKALIEAPCSKLQGIFKGKELYLLYCSLARYPAAFYGNYARCKSSILLGLLKKSFRAAQRGASGAACNKMERRRLPVWIQARSLDIAAAIMANFLLRVS